MRHPNQEALLKKEGIRRLPKDFRLATRSELVPLFAARSGRIILTKLIKSIIWQVYENIQKGIAPPIRGNIRTFWYLYVKPVLSHIPDDDYVKTDPYDTMLSLFTRLIMDLKLFRYSDFDFADENWENRQIGSTHPHILLFAEKRGWVRFLREQNRRFGISTLALGGSPSALTSEYTVDALRQIPLTRRLQLFGIVDYDPSGHLIAHAFQKQLALAGLVNTELITLIHPQYYSESQLQMFQFPLPTRQPTKTNHWFQSTGGIHGQRFGLESESMPQEQLSQLVQQRIQPYFFQEQKPASAWDKENLYDNIKSQFVRRNPVVKVQQAGGNYGSFDCPVCGALADYQFSSASGWCNHCDSHFLYVGDMDLSTAGEEMSSTHWISLQVE